MKYVASGEGPKFPTALILFPWFFFLSVFCLFYKDFKSSEGWKIVDVFDVSFFGKNEEKKDMVYSYLVVVLSN